MIINDKGKLFGKVSIVDIIIVLLIVLAVAGGIFSYLNNKERPKANPSVITEQTKETFIDLELSDIDEYVKSAVVLNDRVYLSQTGAYLGKIVKINSKPHKKEITGTNGMMVFADIPQKYDITISIIVSANQTENGFYITDNIHLACGDMLPIKTELLEVDSIIKRVSEEMPGAKVSASPHPAEEPDKTN